MAKKPRRGFLEYVKNPGLFWQEVREIDRAGDAPAPGDDDRVVDTDGDGLIDELDQPYKYKTNNFFADSDGDCFDDDFEVRHYDEGFRPDVKDGRGCDPMSPLTPGCTCADNDGDGLSYQVEA